MIVFNQAIVNKCDPLFLIEVRMCIRVSLVTMRCPPGVSQTYIMLVARRRLKLHALDTVATKSVRRGELSCHEFVGHRVDGH